MSSFDAFSVDGEELNINSSSAHPFADHHEDDTYSGYDGGYSSFSGGFPTEGDVAVDHTAAESPEAFGFSDPNPNYSQSPFESVPVENGNENGNGYGDDVFVSDGPVLPPPSEMEPEEGYALREWRR